MRLLLTMLNVNQKAVHENKRNYRLNRKPNHKIIFMCTAFMVHILQDQPKQLHLKYYLCTIQSPGVGVATAAICQYKSLNSPLSWFLGHVLDKK